MNNDELARCEMLDDNQGNHLEQVKQIERLQAELDTALENCEVQRRLAREEEAEDARIRDENRQLRAERDAYRETAINYACDYAAAHRVVVEPIQCHPSRSMFPGYTRDKVSVIVDKIAAAMQEEKR
jgi:hypothetical protein